jgi:DNA-binding NtrC family response regulator
MTHSDPIQRKRISILLVDGDPWVRSATKGFLELLGFRVVDTDSGGEAIRMLEDKEQEFDVVIIDFKMPNMNGLETFIHMSKINTGIRGILFSETPEGDCLQGRKFNNLNYLGKPSTCQELGIAVHRAIA